MPAPGSKLKLRANFSLRRPEKTEKGQKIDYFLTEDLSVTLLAVLYTALGLGRFKSGKS